MHIVVVGGGIVGLAGALHLVERGHAVTVVDRRSEAVGASYGNAGGVAVTEVVPASIPGLLPKVPKWLADPLGPLYIRPFYAPRLIPWLLAFLAAGKLARVHRIARALAMLNRRADGDLAAMMARIGIGHQFHRVGALVVYRDDAARRADAFEWEIKRDNGVRAEEIDRKGITDLEPAIGPAMASGIFQPDWAHVDDPAAIMAALGDHLRARAVTFRSGEVTDLRRADGVATGVRLADGGEIDGDAVVVAAGAWSGRLAASVGDKVLLESERGYNTTIPDPGITVNREVIFGAEKFVVTPLKIGLRIGGAAEFAGLDAAPNHARCRALETLAQRGLPKLDTTDGRRWMGHRPATPDSLPVIGASLRLGNVYYAFGHGHLGLTQSAVTGGLLADLIDGRSPAVDQEPFSIARFARSSA